MTSQSSEVALLVMTILLSLATLCLQDACYVWVYTKSGKLCYEICKIPIESIASSLFSSRRRKWAATCVSLSLFFFLSFLVSNSCLFRTSRRLTPTRNDEIDHAWSREAKIKDQTCLVNPFDAEGNRNSVPSTGVDGELGGGEGFWGRSKGESIAEKGINFFEKEVGKIYDNRSSARFKLDQRW